jgi:hypothetical protein
MCRFFLKELFIMVNFLCYFLIKDVILITKD